MERIAPKIIPSARKNPVSLHIIPPYVWVVLGMILGLAAIVIGVREFAHLWAGTSDHLFTEFRHIFPGQSASDIEAKGFSCGEDKPKYYSADKQYCFWIPQEGAFSRVEVVIKKDAVHQVNFLLRDQSLRIGDVAAILESSDFHSHPGIVIFHLPDLFVVARSLANIKPFSFYTPVSIVTFAANDESRAPHCLYRQARRCVHVADF